MFDFSELSDRINYGLKKTGKSQTKLAEECGVKSPSVNNWVTGKTKELMASVAIKASKSLNVDLNWLITGKGSPDADAHDIAVLDDNEQPSDDYVQIKEYSIKCAAGNGREPTYEEQHESVPATYRLSWFQRIGVNPNHCKRFVVTGDSMIPVLYNNDRILVDLSDTFPIHNNHVYAIVFGNEVRVKRLISQMNGDLIIRSDNRDSYPDEIIKHDEENVNFRVIGRVIEKSGDGGL
jgi:phage repressor protein C with HTH and peptisase S24 domain